MSMERRGATESELRNAQMLAVEAAREGAQQGRHRATVANAAGDAARSIAHGANVIIPASVDAVGNAASTAAHAAMKASNGDPASVADEVRRATDIAIEFSIRGA